MYFDGASYVYIFFGIRGLEIEMHATKPWIRMTNHHVTPISMESCDSEEAEKELRVELILLGEFSRLLINPRLIDSQMVHIDHIEANSKAFPKSLSLFVPRKGKKTVSGNEDDLQYLSL